MNRAEVYAVVGAGLLGVAMACMQPSIAAFVGWPAGCLAVAFILIAITRIP